MKGGERLDNQKIKVCVETVFNLAFIFNFAVRR